MRFRIVSDSNSEAKLDEIHRSMNSLGFEEYFLTENYDNVGRKLGVVLMCRDSNLKFKQRIRFSRKDSSLYMDIMLDLEEMKLSNTLERKRIVGEKIASEVPMVIAKYKFADFDLPRFTKDLRGWFERNGWIRSEFPEYVDGD